MRIAALFSGLGRNVVSKGAYEAYNYGGPWGGGSVGLLVLILVILLLMGRV
jgi:hypothetical protein